MGKIELDHTGSGGGVKLSSDGTDLLLDGTAIGGGGAALELYAENPSSPTAPSATGTNAVAIGSQSSATNTNNIAIGYKASATGSTNSVAIGTGTLNNGSKASGESALAMTGGVAGGLSSIALGKSYASGTDSFAAAIANNTSSYGSTGGSCVAMGYLTKAASGNSSAIGLRSLASGSNSLAMLRGQATAAAGNCIAIGYQSEATQPYSVALGYQSKADVRGKFAYQGTAYRSAGQSQMGLVVLIQATTDATPETMSTTDGRDLDTAQIILPNNSAYAFHGTIVARQQASQGTACAAWKVEGLIRREGSAGTTVLVNSATTVLDNTPAWGMALSADTTNGGLKIEVTGAAATNIRWVATINTSEVTY